MIRAIGLETVIGRKILAAQTAANGTSYVQFTDSDSASYACEQITILNDSGTTLQWGYGANGDSAPTGHTATVPSGTWWTVRGLSDSRQLFIRRADTSTTQVTIKGIAETMGGSQ